MNDLIYYMKLVSGSYGNVPLVKLSKNKFFHDTKNISCKQIVYGKLQLNLE